MRVFFCFSVRKKKKRRGSLEDNAGQKTTEVGDWTNRLTMRVNYFLFLIRFLMRILYFLNNIYDVVYIFYVHVNLV